MEVFLAKLPPINEDQLKKELKPHLEALGIAEYYCSKARGKDFALVTFIDASDGSKFLQRHGESLPSDGGSAFFRTSSRRLLIANSLVAAKKSRRQLDEKLLSHLKLEQKRRAEKAKKADRKTQPATDSSSFTVSSVACGKNIFVQKDSQLSFVPQTSTSTSCSAKITRRALIVSSDTDGFRIDVPYTIIQDFIVARQCQKITLVLTETPRFYESFRTQTYDRNSEPMEKRGWVRETHFHKLPGHTRCVSQCLVYQFQVVDRDFEQLVRRWKTQNYVSITEYDLLAEPYTGIPGDFYASWMKVFESELLDPRRHKGLPFPFLFQVQGLVWNNYLHPSDGHRMLEGMAEAIRVCRAKGADLPFSVESMKTLRQRIPYPCPGVDPEQLDVSELLDIILDKERIPGKVGTPQNECYRTSLPSHQAWVMKAIVTPTRILLDGPDPESKNQILRKYSHHAEYFLRCSFCDEDGQDLAFNPKVSNDRIYDRYQEVMRAGIQIADRRYMFLGFSHSSLRAHSVWFMAPFMDGKSGLQSCSSVIRGLGDFDAIRVPAKCAARIGQAFSETPFSVPVSSLGIESRSIPDVKSKDGSRVFSDGVGTISAEAMELFWDYLPSQLKSTAPTCFQIRWAGAKGMLALDSSLKGKVFCIRDESMRKFTSSDVAEMGICDTSSRPLRLWLNRPMIKILEDMGINPEWFLELQKKELENLRAVTIDIAKTSDFLRQQSIATPMGFPSFLKYLSGINIDYRDDDFMRAVMENAVLRELRSLKHKARIPVSKGVTLFGIMDETGFLKENEVYITFDKSQEKISRPPREGQVLVTRSPALHPGDIQLVDLARPPKGSPLRDLKNCIVFSQQGDRDLPSKLSGGDLDGDIYNVIWDSEAMPKRTFGPANYPRVTAPTLDRPVTSKDIIDFFINFMKTDILGLIATRHLTMADYNAEGTMSPECLSLAELHSTAVDSSKTGIPVDNRSLPKAPKFRPDFLSPATPLKVYDIGQVELNEEDDDDDDDDGMGVFKHRYYESEKILGTLYRSVDEKKIWAEDVKRHDKAEGGDIWEGLLSIPKALVWKNNLDVDYKRQTERAWEIRNMYESSVSDLMYQFSENPRRPISEVEVFCGFILDRHGKQTRRQRDMSSKLREEIDRTMSWIVKMMQDPEGEEGEDSVARQKDVLELCWACLVVGCADDKERLNSEYVVRGLRSFRILAAGCMFKQLELFLSVIPQDGKETATGGFVGVRGGSGGKKMTLPLR
ncbi:unnamed protein product [Clonostachys rosea f. rosea IK726]|uniref:RNA-dependent RNA polymerase n=2 Tax=Bionectria ochroleuca TaxID=29856 RepID=A0A0B7JLV3_BIOOC|nr:unnamed protein product [Clonostachys rosea f. rosea IK726]